MIRATQGTRGSRGSQGPSRQFRLVLQRCLGAYGVVFVVAMLFGAMLCVQIYQQSKAEPTGLVLSGLNAERFLMPILLITAVVWQWVFFQSAICHGVSRASYMKASAIGAAAMALAVSVAAVGSRVVLSAAGFQFCASADRNCRMPGPLDMPLSVQFLYAWERKDWSDASSVQDFATYSPILTGGTLFVFLKFFSLMLSYVALGMLIGAVLAWAASKSTWFAGALAVLIWFAGGQLRDSSLIHIQRMQVLEPFFTFGADQNRLVQAMSGRLVSFGADGVEIGTYVVWVPLAESLVLFAVCAWGAWLLTKRREVHPARRMA